MSIICHLCASDILIRTMLTENEYFFKNTGLKYPKHTQTNNVKDLPRSGRPRLSSDRDDRALQRLVRRVPFATSPVLKQNWLSIRRV
jgi:hypothetical protein